MHSLDLLPLQAVAENLWEIERPLKAPALRIDHRMTVARLASGELWIHSPVEFSKPLAASLAALGTPAHFVAPSTFHDLHWPEWFARYPQATFYCAPGVMEEHPDLPFHDVLASAVSESWENEIPKLLVRGMPKLNEFVFFHSPSRTLIVADLLFHFSPDDQNLLGKLFLKLNGLGCRPGCSRLFRWFIRDRNAFKTSLDQIFAWDFDRIIVGHGAIVRHGGKQALREAMVWLE
ncbi:MAG: DUF4336 domain-containing protein [Verrucomicrobiota bacterium]